MNSYLNILSDLCLIEATSKRAIKQVYKLATHDNEYKYDAHTKFVSLFQVVLADNCLNYSERFKLLKELEVEHGLSKILIDAYERMLKTGSFYGNVHSGSNDLYENDYRPQGNAVSEYRVYYLSAIKKLQNIALSNDEPNNLNAKEGLISRLPDQFIGGEYQKMVAVMRTLIMKEGGLKIELRNKLLELKSYRYNFAKERTLLIDKILEEYEPEGIEQELKTIVINPPWIREENDLGQYVDVSKENAIQLAEKYLEDGADWVNHLNLLLQGEQRQTFHFAHRIGASQYEKVPLLERMFETFLEIPDKEQNWLFVNGIAVGTDTDDFTRMIITKLLSNERTERIGISQLRFIKHKTPNDFEIIRPYLINNPNYLRQIEYLELNEFSSDHLIELTNWLKEINYSYALEILNDVIRKDSTRWDELKPHIKELVFIADIFAYSSFINNTLHIEDLLIKSINDEPTKERVKWLIDIIIEHYRDFNFEKTTLLNRIVYSLLENHWDESWSCFESELLNDNYNYGLNNVLENYNFDNGKLFVWANEDPAKRPQVAIRFMNIYLKNEDDSLSFEPSVKNLIDDFGQNSLMLDRLKSKLGSYMISGASAEGLYKKRRAMIEPLLDHEIPEVQEFANKMVEYFNNAIEREKTFGENYKLGY